MKLSECKHGVLVEKNGKVGMVVGVAQNSFKEAVPVVQWQYSTDHFAVHHTNLKLYKE